MTRVAFVLVHDHRATDLTFATVSSQGQESGRLPLESASVDLADFDKVTTRVCVYGGRYEREASNRLRHAVGLEPA